MHKQILFLFCCFILSCVQDKAKHQPSIVNEKSVSETPKHQTIDIKKKIIKHYICYAMDDKPSVKIWIAFAENNHAFKIKYKGQQESMKLEFIKEEYIEGGAYPTIKQHYHELLNETINGTYVLTHSGIWDYVEYTSVNNPKKYNFTILHDENPYGKNPCFN